MNAEPWVTAIDVAKHLEVVEDTIYRWRAKACPRTTIGRLWKFQLSEVDEWVRAGGADDESVWLEVPDFRERYELPDGLYRQSVPSFDEIVVRELLVNALVHRPYTLPESATSEIHQRIGGEIHPKQLKRALEDLIERGAVRFEGNNRWRRYWAIS